MQHARHTRTAPRIPTGALAGAIGIALMLVVGCTQVGDNLTGVELNRGRPTTCIKQCNDLYKMLFNDEQKLHETNVQNCQALPQPDKGACLAAEAARHEAEMDRLSQAKKDCQDGCHRQGSGSAG